MYTKRDQEVLDRLQKLDNKTLSEIYLYLQEVGPMKLSSSIELPMWLALMSTSRISQLVAKIIVERIQDGNAEGLEQFVATA